MYHFYDIELFMKRKSQEILEEVREARRASLAVRPDHFSIVKYVQDRWKQSVKSNQVECCPSSACC